MPRKCCVPSCNIRVRELKRVKKKDEETGEKYPAIFKMPKNDSFFERWRSAVLAATNKEVTRKEVICERHFHEDDLDKFTIVKIGNVINRHERLQYTVKSGAIPTIFPKLTRRKRILNKEGIKNNVKEEHSKKKIRRNSGMELCKKSIATNSKKALHKMGTRRKSKILLDKKEMRKNSKKELDVQEEIPYTDSASEQTSSDENVDSNSVSSQTSIGENVDSNSASTDGNILLTSTAKHVDRNSVPLKTGPTIVYHHIQKNVNTNSVLSQTSAINGNVNFNLPQLRESLAKGILIGDVVSLLNNTFSFNKLLTNLHLIQKPNRFWYIAPTLDFIACVRWTTEYKTDRKVIIEKDLSVKIFLKDRQIVIGNLSKANSFDDLSSLLSKVEKFGICRGANDQSFPNCLVCLPNSRPGDLGRPRLFCANCLSARKNILLKERKELVTETKEKETKRKFYQVISCERRKNKRLGLKIQRLQDIVDTYRNNGKCMMRRKSPPKDTNSLPQSSQKHEFANSLPQSSEQCEFANSLPQSSEQCEIASSLPQSSGQYEVAPKNDSALPFSCNSIQNEEQVLQTNTSLS